MKAVVSEAPRNLLNYFDQISTQSYPESRIKSYIKHWILMPVQISLSTLKRDHGSGGSESSVRERGL